MVHSRYALLVDLGCVPVFLTLATHVPVFRTHAPVLRTVATQVTHWLVVVEQSVGTAHLKYNLHHHLHHN
jgi:hypothetical protein